MSAYVSGFLRRGKLRWIFLLAALGAVACYVAGGDADPVPLPTEADMDRPYSAEVLRADLDHLVLAIEEIHPDPYFQVSQSEFQGEVAAIRDALDAPLTRTEFFFRIAPLFARIGDGHTGVQFPMPEVRRHLASGGLLFPLGLRFVDGRAIVSRGAGDIEAGAEVLSIDGRSMEDIRGQFSALVGSRRVAHREAFVETYFAYLLWLANGSRSEFDARVVGPDDTEPTSRTVAAMRLDQLREEGEHAPGAIRYPYYSYETDPSRRIGLMKIDYFVGTDDFESFLSEAFSRIADDSVDHLVIDLTNNAGGTTNVANQLLRRLSDVPLRTYASYEMKVSAQVRDRLKRQLPRAIRCLPIQYLFPQGRRVWGTPIGENVEFEGETIEPAAVNDRFTGTVWVLVNGKTFSTATTFAAAIQDYGLGTLVGEETGGIASFFGDGFPIRLPNTQLDATISHKVFIRPSGDTGPGGVVPQYIVRPTTADMAAGVNPYVEWVRNRVGSTDDSALPSEG